MTDDPKVGIVSDVLQLSNNQWWCT